MYASQDRCRETRQLIKDMEVMAHADYFVGSSTSGIPTIIATLRMTVYLKSQVSKTCIILGSREHSSLGNRSVLI